MPELEAFQNAFSAALRRESSAVDAWLNSPDDRGLDVYRNTVTAGSVDALASIFPTVSALVGEAWFRAAAARFARVTPPTRPSMLDYGEAFPAWLGTFPPAADTPYLGLVAHIDWLWWEAHFAGDSDTLSFSAIAALDACDLDGCTLKLHPAVRLARFDQTLASLWLAHQTPALSVDGFQIEDRAEYLLLTREGLIVRSRLIDAETYAFMSACAEGASILVAAARAVETSPTTSLPDVLRTGLEACAFSRIDHLSGQQSS